MAFRLTLAGPIDTVDIPKMAAEFKRAVPTFVPASANYDWTGFYIGAHGEFSSSNTSGSAVNLATGATTSRYRQPA